MEKGPVLWNKHSSSMKFPMAKNVNGEINQCTQGAHGFVPFTLNTEVAPRKINVYVGEGGL